MIKALYSAGTGMRAQQIAVDVAANNLANVNTPGFKRSTVNFKDLLYVALREPGAATSNSTSTPSGSLVGTGTEVDSIPKIFTQGVLEPTERELDLAIQGQGFFQVRLADGTVGYTRNGAFQIDATGNVVTGDGFKIEPAIVVPNDVQISVGQDGTVSGINTAGVSSTIGQVQLAKFLNPSGLRAQGNNIYTQTSSSGSPVPGNPGSAGFGLLQQAFLERSNVEVVNEMVGLIVSQRAYEFSSRAIRSTDDMLQNIGSIVR